MEHNSSSIQTEKTVRKEREINNKYRRSSYSSIHIYRAIASEKPPPPPPRESKSVTHAAVAVAVVALDRVKDVR